MQKRALAIHDISCIGRCSLTVALPILSAAGIETCVLPTAVLSTQTGGMQGFTFHDLTSEFAPITDHWESLHQRFDGIYTGYLGSEQQIHLVTDIIRRFKTENALVVIDPVMADHGKFYDGMDESYCESMKTLLQYADIVLPNYTEACFLLGVPYTEHPTKEEVMAVLKKFPSLGAKATVISGVAFADRTFGSMGYDSVTDSYFTEETPYLDRIFHGTGDVFASVITACTMNRKPLQEALHIATDFTYRSIVRTLDAGTDLRFGVQFEKELPTLILKLQ